MSDYSELKRLAEGATPQNFDSAEEHVAGGYIECPHCGGQGEVEMEADYCNYDNTAIGVQFYGIGNEFGAAEAYYRAANPAAVLALIAENDKLLKLINRMIDQYVPLSECEGLPGYSRVVELVEVVAEKDQLQAEVEALRKALITIRQESHDIGACECAADALIDSRKTAK